MIIISISIIIIIIIVIMIIPHRARTDSGRRRRRPARRGAWPGSYLCRLCCLLPYCVCLIRADYTVCCICLRGLAGERVRPRKPEDGQVRRRNAMAQIASVTTVRQRNAMAQSHRSQPSDSGTRRPRRDGTNRISLAQSGGRYNIYIYIYIHTYVCLSLSLSLYIYIYIYIYTHPYIYIYIYIYVCL